MSVFECLRQGLVPQPTKHLCNPKEGCGVCVNVVSNVMTDPSGKMPLLELNIADPVCEMKSAFRAVIKRNTDGLSEEQRVVPGLEARSMTHLTFGKGSISGSGVRSDEEALLQTQKLRQLFFWKLRNANGQHYQTNLRRFTVVNRVMVHSVGHPVNLASMSAANPMTCTYAPDVFPGLFYRFTIEFKNRKHYNCMATGHRTGRVQLTTEDPSVLQKDAPKTAPSGLPGNVLLSTEQIEQYLPRSKRVSILVFPAGNLVMLGINHVLEGMMAFASVTRICGEHVMSVAELKAQNDLRELNKQKATASRRNSKKSRAAAAANNHADPLGLVNSIAVPRAASAPAADDSDSEGGGVCDETTGAKLSSRMKDTVQHLTDTVDDPDERKRLIRVAFAEEKAVKAARAAKQKPPVCTVFLSTPKPKPKQSKKRSAAEDDDVLDPNELEFGLHSNGPFYSAAPSDDLQRAQAALDHLQSLMDEPDQVADTLDFALLNQLVVPVTDMPDL